MDLLDAGNEPRLTTRLVRWVVVWAR